MLTNNGVPPVKADYTPSPKLTVESIDNHIYFYSYVDSDRCLALIRTIRELDTRLRNEHSSRMLPAGHPSTPIWLHIQSGGGELFTGLNIAGQIKKIETPIYSIVEGYCASAATIISMSCKKRFILSTSFMLIHQLSGLAWGTYEQIKDDVHLMDMAMSQLRGFYIDHSKMDRVKITELLKHDSWFKPKECIELGLADEIV